LIELHIPGCQSLKEKRRTVKGLIDRLRAKYNISVAEVDFQGKWQRSKIGVAWISADGKGAETRYQEIMKVIDGRPEIQIIGVEKSCL